MKRYRDRSLQLLIATDVAARGIDVNDVTHVINFSLPDEVENYTHRSGRTARAGKTGVSLSLINGKELGKIRRIEKIIGKSFEKKLVPQASEVVEKQLLAMTEKIRNVDINEERIEPYLPSIMESMQDLSKEDIIKRFASLEFTRFLDYYQNAPDLNVDARERDSDRGERGERRDRGSRTASNGYTRLFINLGSVDEFSRGDMLGLICDAANISGKSVGKIDMKGVFTFFEVQDAEVKKVFDGFQGTEYNGRAVRVEVSGDENGGGRSRGGDGGRRRERKGGSGGSFRGDRRDSGGFRGERSGERAGRRQTSRSRY